MCLAIPAKIVKIKGQEAIVDYGGVTKTTRLDLMDAKIGEYVLIHAGFAIEKVDEELALKSIEDIKKLMKNE